MTVKFLKGISNNVERSTSSALTPARKSASSGAQISSSLNSIISKSDAAISTLKPRADTEKVRDYDKAKSLAKDIADDIKDLDKDEASSVHNPTAATLRDSF